MEKNLMPLGKLTLILLLTVLFAAGCQSRTQQPAYNSARHLAALIDLGLVALRTGDYAKAMSTFNEADRISPNNADIKHHIGRTYYQLDNPIKAIELYLESLALDPTKTDVHNNLGIVYMTQREYEKARREFQYCIEDITYGNAEMSRYNMGLLEENLNNPDKAVPYYMHVISSGGNMAPSAYYRMAYMAFKKADYRSSVDYLTAAVRLNSEYPDAFFLMGESFEKLGFEDEAAEAYGRCVTLDSTSIRGIEAQKRIRAIMHEYK